MKMGKRRLKRLDAHGVRILSHVGRLSPMWGKGEVKIGGRSSLRKLMRAARRGRVPDERMVVIKAAESKAYDRRKVYMNSAKRREAA